MYCPGCKKELPVNARLCPECGFGLLSQLGQIKEEIGKMSIETKWLIERMDRYSLILGEMEPIIANLFKKKEASKPPDEAPPTFAEQKKEPDLTPVNMAPATPEPQKRKDVEADKPSATISEIKLGQKWLLITGIIVTVLAFGWFLKYSFDRNWIGFEGRVALAYIGGLLFLGCGEFFRRKHLDAFGLYLIGGGIAALYFATFAGYEIYHLFSQPLTFVLMVLVTALACILALVYDKKWLAVIGLIGGFLTPVILSTGFDQQIALMSYMTVLNAGILAISFFKEWPLLNGLGFFLTWSLFIGWYIRYYSISKFWPTLVFLHVFFLIYAGILFAYQLRRVKGVSLHGFWMQLPNSFLTLGFVYALIRGYTHSEYASIFTLAYAALFLWMATTIHRRRPQQEKAIVLLVAKALLFLAVTIPILLSRHWVVVFWSLQALALLWAAIRINHRLLYSAFYVFRFFSDASFFFYFLPIVYGFNFDSFSFSTEYFQDLPVRWLTGLIVVGGCFLCSRWLKKDDRQIATISGMKPYAFFSRLFLIYLFFVLNIEISSYFHAHAPNARFAAISVLWALFSIVMLIRGFTTNASKMRIVALFLFGCTLLKVFFIDMARVSTPYRIVSFLVLGTVMIGASYMYFKFKKRLLEESVQREVEDEKA